MIPLKTCEKNYSIELVQLLFSRVRCDFRAKMGNAEHGH